MDTGKDEEYQQKKTYSQALESSQTDSMGKGGKQVWQATPKAKSAGKGQRGKKV